MNALRALRGASALAHYKSELVKEDGPVDEATLTDLLTDIAHHLGDTGPILKALASASRHKECEEAATEDDPDGDAIRTRTLAIRDAAIEAISEEGTFEVDESTAILSEGDDNGCYVLGWGWFSFAGTQFDKDNTPEQRMEYAIQNALGGSRNSCGLNADWSVSAWLILPDQPGTPPNRGSGYYLTDNEDGTASLVWRIFDGDEDPITIIHTWTDATAFAAQNIETLKALCIKPTPLPA